MNYRATKEHGCLAPGGARYAPLSEIDQTLFTPEGIETLVKAGYLEAFEPNQRPAKPKGRTGLVSPSIWVLDPDDVKDRSLDELNVMILERDENLEQFETVEEARWWLTQDYEAVEV